MNKQVNRYYRNVRYMMRYLFRERLFGLDFSMSDISLRKKTGGAMHGYFITPERHIKEIFNCLDTRKNTAFLDIRCGKGFVLKYAAGKFLKWGGVEYDNRLAQICKRNMRRLGYDNSRIFNGDAREFNSYGDYNTFYLFNPFEPEILKSVLEKLPTRGVTIIYYHPIYHQLILDTGAFRVSQQLYDPERNYYTNIYESIE